MKVVAASLFGERMHQQPASLRLAGDDVPHDGIEVPARLLVVPRDGAGRQDLQVTRRAPAAVADVAARIARTFRQEDRLDACLEERIVRRRRRLLHRGRGRLADQQGKHDDERPGFHVRSVARSSRTCRSLVPQRQHRVDAGGAPCGEPAQIQSPRSKLLDSSRVSSPYGIPRSTAVFFDAAGRRTRTIREDSDRTHLNEAGGGCMKFVYLALVLIFVATPVRAQSTATLEGTITDAQGAVMPGVTVTIKNKATSAERNANTDAAGRYVAASLSPGGYTVVAHLQGFQDQTREVILAVAQTTVLDLKLGVGGVAENVTVAGGAPLIETATSSVGQVMPERTVQEIPLNGRHFVDLGPLMPGGSTSPQNAGLSAPLRGQGSFSFMSAGNRETAVNMMVNGINLNDLSNSQETFQPSINTVSEFKVDNSTFSAEYGCNSGAIVNVATRSGSNQTHGEAFDFYRDDQFDSRNYFNPASTRTDGTTTPQSLFNRKQFGANLGGPVVKNRWFYFGSY